MTATWSNIIQLENQKIKSFEYLPSLKYTSMTSILPYYNSRTVKYKKHKNCNCEDERQVAIFLLLLDSISCCL